MAIKVGHSGNAGAVAGAAFGGAQGQARSALGVQARAAAERERARLLQAAEADKSRAFSLEQQGRSFQHGLESQVLNADLQQSAAEAAQLRGRDDLVFGLTTRQRMEMDQLADSEAKAMSDPAFSPSEKEELRYRFAQKRAGLQPVARPKPKTAAELFAERTHTDPKTGRVYALDENGMPGRSIYEPPEKIATWQDKTKAWDLALKSSADPLTGKSDMKAARALYAEIMGGTAAPGEAPPEATSAGMEIPAPPRGFFGSIMDRIRGLSGTGTEEGEPNLSTPEGIEQKVAQIDSKQVEPVEDGVAPEKIGRLSTIDDQVRHEGDVQRTIQDEIVGRRKKAEADFGDVDPKLVARAKTDQQRALALDPTGNLYREEVRHGLLLRDSKARVEALEKRRSELIKQKEILKGSARAMQIVMQRGAK